MGSLVAWLLWLPFLILSLSAPSWATYVSFYKFAENREFFQGRFLPYKLGIETPALSSLLSRTRTDFLLRETQSINMTTNTPSKNIVRNGIHVSFLIFLYHLFTPTLRIIVGIVEVSSFVLRIFQLPRDIKDSSPPTIIFVPCMVYH